MECNQGEHLSQRRPDRIRYSERGEIPFPLTITGTCRQHTIAEQEGEEVSLHPFSDGAD
jgi:hypothetical protein